MLIMNAIEKVARPTLMAIRTAARPSKAIGSTSGYAGLTGTITCGSRQLRYRYCGVSGPGWLFRCLA